MLSTEGDGDPDVWRHKMALYYHVIVKVIVMLALYSLPIWDMLNCSSASS